MTLPRYYYSRDPLDIVIADESKTCKGCKQWVKYIVCGEPKMICEKGRKKRNDKCYDETTGHMCGGGK